MINKLEYWEAGYDAGIILKARTQFWEEQSNKSVEELNVFLKLSFTSTVVGRWLDEKLYVTYLQEMHDWSSINLVL